MDVLLAMLGAAVVSAAAPPAVCQISWEDGHLEIEADRAIQVKQFRLEDPERRILDLMGAELADPHTPGRITVGTSGVRQVRIARHPDKASVRIVLDLDAESDLTLQTYDGGRRLIGWPGSGKPLGPPAPGSAEAFVGPLRNPGLLAAAPAALALPSGSRRDAGAPRLLVGPPTPGLVVGPPAPGSVVGPPAPGSVEALIGPPAPGARFAFIGPWPAQGPFGVPGSAGVPPASRMAASSGRPDPRDPRAVRSAAPLAVASPAPDEALSEATGSRAVPWPAAPQVVESIRLRRSGRETTLEIRSKAQLMAWVQDEWQASRLTVRIPRSTVAADVPRPRGAVSRLALRREEDAWALALELEDGPHVFDSAPIDGGRGLRIRMRPAPALNPAKPLVMIDPGHGGYDPGALGPGGGNESQVTLDVARLVVKGLADAGLQPLLTRTMDAEVRLPDRVALMDRYSPVVYISLHCNSSEAPEATGIETYYRHDSGQKLARSIHEKLVAETGRQDRGVRSARLYVLRGERIPATLVEMGFISSREEEERLKDPAFQKIVARAIADGIKGYLDSRPVTSAGERAPVNPGSGG